MDSEFEQRLRRQPVKPVPPEWRAEILAAAHAAQAPRHPSPVTRHTWFAVIHRQLSALLWPHPRAWAGLAAVWVCIFMLNLSMRDQPPVLAERTPSPSPEMVAELKQQQKMLAELIGAPEVQVADRQRFLLPRPRSERGEILAG